MLDITSRTLSNAAQGNQISDEEALQSLLDEGRQRGPTSSEQEEDSDPLVVENGDDGGSEYNPEEQSSTSTDSCFDADRDEDRDLEPNFPGPLPRVESWRLFTSTCW